MPLTTQPSLDIWLWISLSVTVWGGRCGAETADRANELHAGGHPAEAQGQLLPNAGLRCCGLQWGGCVIENAIYVFLLSV